MSYNVYAAPVEVPEEHRPTMLGLRFLTEKEAIETVWQLYRAGWFVYRVSGPDGYELTERDIHQLCGPPSAATQQARS